jgi:hypothetical protein
MDTRTGMILPEEHVPEGQRKYFVPVRRKLTPKERADAQVRLYSPCPCGSGKKFKFCCKDKQGSAQKESGVRKLPIKLP